MRNDAKIRAAKPQDKPYKLTDSHQLYLLVKPSGSKLWKWSYSYDGKQRTLHFGVHPKVSLADARAKRDEASALLNEGHDPAMVRKLLVEANLEAGRQTFERLAREWFENIKTRWALIHADDVIRSLERDVFLMIGGFRAAFSTIMNEWAERHGKHHDRAVIDLMLAHVPKEKVEGAYNRAAFMLRRRELAASWADMLSEGLADPIVLVERPAKAIGLHSRRRLLEPVGAEFCFPRFRHVA